MWKGERFTVKVRSNPQARFRGSTRRFMSPKSRQLQQIEWLKVAKFEKTGGYLSKWGGGNEKSRGRAEKLGDNLAKWGGWSRKWGANRDHRPVADQKRSMSPKSRQLQQIEWLKVAKFEKTGG